MWEVGAMTGVEHYTIDPTAKVLMRDLGLSVGNVLRRAGLPGDLLSGGPATLTADQAGALWEAIAVEADDPNLAIKVGQAISVESFSPPIFAAICSPNLNVAAARIAKHKALIGPIRVIVTPTGRGTEIELRWPADHRFHEMVTTELVWWVALVRLATRTHVVPVAVTSTQPPADPQALTDYLGVPVGQGDRNTVTFSDRDAARPFVTANEPMWELFEPELRRRLAELEANATTAQRVRAALLELLPSGRGAIDAVAHELTLSTRTLQRRLHSEDTSFQAVLAQTRESLARHYINQGHLSTTEIALLLGYDEPKSFYRAFHTWTGQTPQQARSAST